jgi:hypothetical protein
MIVSLKKIKYLMRQQILFRMRLIAGFHQHCAADGLAEAQIEWATKCGIKGRTRPRRTESSSVG